MLKAIIAQPGKENFPVPLKLMSFSSVVKSPESVAGAQMVKLPWLPLLREKVKKSAAFV